MAGERVSLLQVRIAEAFASMASTWTEDFDVFELIARLVESCVDLGVADAAGVLMLDHDRELQMMGSSDESSRLVELYELAVHEGPCSEVLTTNAALFADIGEIRTRWPRCAVAVSAAGYVEVAAFPMRRRDRVIGSLNLFRSATPRMSEEEAGIAQALADVATAGLLLQRALLVSRGLSEQLQAAFDTRLVIEQAKGILAEYSHNDMDEAFRALRSYARASHLKLGAVAEWLVHRQLSPEAVMHPRTAS